jgi:hypothetical protein
MILRAVGGSVAIGRVTLVEQVKGDDPDQDLVLQVRGWA